MEEPQFETFDWKNIIWSMIKEKKLSEEHLRFLLTEDSINVKDINSFIVSRLCEKECGIEDNAATILWVQKMIKRVEKTIVRKEREEKKACKRVVKFEKLSALLGPINEEMDALCNGRLGWIPIQLSVLKRNLDPVFLEHIKTIKQGFDKRRSDTDEENSGVEENLGFAGIYVKPSMCEICAKRFYEFDGGHDHSTFCIVCLNNYVEAKLVERMNVMREDFHTNMQDFMNVMHLSDELLAASKDKETKAVSKKRKVGE